METEENGCVYLERSEYISGHEILLKVLSEFSKRTGLKIRGIYRYRDSTSPYTGSDYDLCIYFNSVPKGLDDIHYLPTAYGNELGKFSDGRYLVPSPNYDGKNIVDEEGNVLAIIDGKTLYVLFDLTCRSRSYTGEILKNLLEDYLIYVKDEDNFDTIMNNRLLDAERKKFMRTFKSAIRESLRYPSDGQNEELQRLKQDLSSALRKYKMMLIQTSKNLDDANLQALYDRLCKLSDNGEISMINGAMRVSLGHIDIKDKGEVYNIGDFDVIICFDEKEIYFTNKTRQIKESHHPHVNFYGVPCFGDITSAVDSFLSKGELEILLIVVVEYLRSYNADGVPETRIELWPLKNPPRKRGKNG